MNMSPDPSDGLANSFYYGESDPITFCMALSVYRLVEYAFAVVAQGLAWMQRGQALPKLAKSSVSNARPKIGYVPLQMFHERTCVPPADASTMSHAF
jgi:hypothetical protein